MNIYCAGLVREGHTVSPTVFLVPSNVVNGNDFKKAEAYAPRSSDGKSVITYMAFGATEEIAKRNLGRLVRHDYGEPILLPASLEAAEQITEYRPGRDYLSEIPDDFWKRAPKH